VILEILGHAKGLDLLLAKDRLHQLVRGEPLLVLRVLEVLLLEVGPEPLDDLAPGELLVLLGADNGGQRRRKAYRFRESALPLLPRRFRLFRGGRLRRNGCDVRRILVLWSFRKNGRYSTEFFY
jgi:hypothetical protein